MYVYFQDFTFAFNPTAQTVNPSGLTFTVKYSMKDAVEITDNMLKNNYTIEVQALRSHSDTVSEVTGECTYVYLTESKGSYIATLIRFYNLDEV